MSLSRENEVKLYYLYMMADGEVSPFEMLNFMRISEKLGVEEEKRKAIVKETESLEGYEDEIFKNIKNIVEKNESLSFEKSQAVHNASIIWNLVNIGYADSVYSSAEKRIVSYLVERWKVEPDIYQEFVDTADTLLALTEQKIWTSNAYRDENKKAEKEKMIDEEKELLVSNIELTLQELGE